MIPTSFRDQILPGTFEYTLSYLIDHELDLSIFDEPLRYYGRAWPETSPHQIPCSACHKR